MSSSSARLGVFLILALLTPAAAAPKSAILLVADGLGPGALEYALSRYAQTGKPALPALAAFLKDSKSALVFTRSTGASVTDSAAAATAYSCGAKTRNGYLGMDAMGKPLTCLQERVKKSGKALGLVTTTHIWDATPAAFSAHVITRDDRSGIQRQQAAFKPDFLLGGAEEEAFRLAPAARSALDKVSSDPDGFFLLVETERTDEAGHANDLPGLLSALEELDQTLAVLLERRRESPDATLFFVSDHDTGGLSQLKDQEPVWATRGHTATPVVLFAAGPIAADLPGALENTEVARLLLRALGLGAP